MALERLLVGVLLIVFIIVVVSAVLRAKARGITLVLTKFDVDAANGTVEIAGRMPGLKAFLLSVMGMDAVTTLKTSPDKVLLETASLSSATQQRTPMPSVAMVEAGYSRPVGMLIAAMILVLVGFFLMIVGAEKRETFISVFGVFALIGAVALAVGYVFKKRTMIRIQNVGGASFQLMFARSFIENVPVDIQKVREASKIIGDCAIRSQMPVSQ